ncbi:MAG: hypothetical protein RR334_03515 [Clostridia bacterium]
MIMEQEKPIKPKSCAECPVVRANKEYLYCKCSKEKAKLHSNDEKDKMWRKCPLNW